MWIFNLTAPYQFKCIPRYYNEGELTFYLRDELRDTTTEIEILETIYQNNILKLVFEEPILKEGQSFEITINEDDNLIYRGKAFSTAQTDLENFELNKGVLKV
jgi:predicted DNA-binding antitoxin AbrB/MazE fold protein